MKKSFENSRRQGGIPRALVALGLATAITTGCDNPYNPRQSNPEQPNPTATINGLVDTTADRLATEIDRTHEQLSICTRELLEQDVAAIDEQYNHLELLEARQRTLLDLQRDLIVVQSRIAHERLVALAAGMNGGSLPSGLANENRDTAELLVKTVEGVNQLDSLHN